MPQPGIDPVRDELMPRVLLHLHRMIEVTPRLRHRHRPRALAHDDHRHSQRDENRLPPREPEPGRVREKEVGQQTFEDGGRVRDVVCPPVLAQQEGGDGGVPRVVGCCRPVLEEVEQRERAEEEGEAPERGGAGQEEVQGEERRCAEGEAQEEGAQGDAGEGFRGVWEVGWVEGLCGWRLCGSGGRGRGVAVCGAVVIGGGRPCRSGERGGGWVRGCWGFEVEVERSA